MLPLFQPTLALRSEAMEGLETVLKLDSLRRHRTYKESGSSIVSTPRFLPPSRWFLRDDRESRKTLEMTIKR
jgi:hypothetical protein